MQSDHVDKTIKEADAATDPAVARADVTRISRSSRAESVRDLVLVEEPVTIMVDKVGSFTVLCTPTDLKALAVGFLFSEGMIRNADEICAVHEKEDLGNVIGVEIEQFSGFEVQRNLIVASSCGMCGVRNIEKMLASIPPCEQSLCVPDGLLFEVVGRLRSQQQLFAVTGAAHAAAVFDAEGEMIAIAEDIGRHNAFDKVIGKCLLARRLRPGLGVALSGRVSLEMVSKAARAGIELIVAVSGVSSHAITAAEHWNVTLCGFVREANANVYTHPARVQIGSNGRHTHAE